MKSAELKKQKNQVRYNLHKQVRKEGFKLETKIRTIYVVFDQLTYTESVQRLRDEFNYAIQTEIPQS